MCVCAVCVCVVFVVRARFPRDPQEGPARACVEQWHSDMFFEKRRVVLRSPCVCVCGVTEYPVTTLGRFRRQGARRLISKPCQRSYGNRVEEMLDAASCTCISDSECLFGPLVAALFVLLVLSGNVFAARRKPSDCKPNPLETHQLYSRLISCTRDSFIR